MGLRRGAASRGPRWFRRALDALYVGITRRKVDWVLDLDIRAFFDRIDHAWMVRSVEHRIGGRRIVRLTQKWLRAGVMEHERWIETEQGTPQGSAISPILADLYLHYVLDLWADHWRRRKTRGDVVIVRYADDVVLGFPVRILGEVFRSKFVAAPKHLFQAGKLGFRGVLRGLAKTRLFGRLLRQSFRQKWVVYAKKPLGDPSMCCSIWPPKGIGARSRYLSVWENASDAPAPCRGWKKRADSQPNAAGRRRSWSNRWANAQAISSHYTTWACLRLRRARCRCRFSC